MGTIDNKYRAYLENIILRLNAGEEVSEQEMEESKTIAQIWFTEFSNENPLLAYNLLLSDVENIK